MKKLFSIFLIAFLGVVVGVKGQPLSSPGTPLHVDLWQGQFIDCFNPTQFSQVVVWLDAQDASTITANGLQEVSEWRDKSGNDHHFTSWQAGFEPEYNGTINGYPAVDFGNGPIPTEGDNMRTDTTPWPGAEPISDAVVFIVGISDVVNEQGTVWHMEIGNGDRWLVHAPWQGGQLIYDAGPAATAPYRLVYLNFTTAGTPWLLTVESSVSNSRQLMAKNGVILAQDGDAYSNTLGNDRLYLCGYTSTANTQDAKIGEVIVWKGPITVADRQLIEGYLAWKWGVTLDDPLHPYASGSPGPPCGS